MEGKEVSRLQLLEVRGLTKYFAGLAAVKNVDFTIEEGRIIGLIGPNGAGKTTILNLISGVLRPTSGSILLENNKIDGLRPDEIVKKGIVRTFQLDTLFNEFTVLENILMGFHIHGGISFLDQIFGTKKGQRDQANLEEKARSILEFLGLTKIEKELAKNLPSGHKRMVGIGIALATKAKLLLLDEGLTGMTEAEVGKAISIIKKIRENGATILLVEHNMKAVMELCEKLVVINFGIKIAEGSCGEVKNNKDVIEAYLGIEENVT